MGYGAWGLKESDMTERLSMSANSKQIFYKLKKNIPVCRGIKVRIKIIDNGIT